MADQVAPQVAAFMNRSRKLAVSHTAFESDWANTTVISADVLDTLAEIKRQPGGDIIILGSNNLCVSLMQENLIDEFQIVVNPVVLGGGTPLFAGLPQKARLTLTESRTFPSGKTMLIYTPAK
jgi:dihydrofolate reductase